MIRETLKKVREATFCIELPNHARHGMPMPTGTGFFVSPDGWFVTAAHVVTKNGAADGETREDLEQAFLTKEPDGNGPGSMCQFPKLKTVLPEYDFALLKVDFDRNSNKEWLKVRNCFPYINISTRQLEMGEPVYSFGYPLSGGNFEKKGNMMMGHSELSPRLTSAIVSSDLEKTKRIMTSADPKHYVLDKALNYGNSGGPVIATETGNVHALCSRFQPVFVPQSHLKDKDGNMLRIMVPSLYGVVSSINNKSIIDVLESNEIPIICD